MLKYKIAKNTIYSAVSEGSNLFLFLVAIIAARYLGDRMFGIFSFALAFVGLFQILPDFGIGYANTIEVARDKTKVKNYFSYSLGLQIFLSFLTFAAIVITINITEKDPNTRVIVYILSIAMLLKAFKTTFRWIFKSLENFSFEALTLTIERFLTLSLCFLVLYMGKGLLNFTYAFTISRIVDITITIIIISYTCFTPIPKINYALWLDFIKRGFPFVIVGSMITIFFQIDAVMLSFMRTPEEVGWYSASYKIIEMLTAIPRIIAYALLPTLSLLHITSKSHVTKLYHKASKYLIMAALPICAYTLFRSNDIIRVIFGNNYEKSIVSLQVLIISILFMFQSNLGETVLASINRWKLVVYSAGISVTINIILNLILIPKYGYIGSGMATVITEFIYFFCINYSLTKAGHKIKNIIDLLRPVIAILPLILALYLCRNLGMIPTTALTIIVYVAAIFITGCLDKEERQLIKTLPSNIFH